MIIKTKVAVLVLHRSTCRGYSYNDYFEILEPLILDLEVVKYKCVRKYWKPMLPNTPLWAAGIRDLEFDTFMLG